MPFKESVHTLLYINKDKSMVKELKKVIDNVIVRDSLEESLELFFHQDISIILTEVSLSGKNNFNHIELFKTSKRDIPIIVYNSGLSKINVKLLSQISNLNIQGLFFNNKGNVVLKKVLEELKIYEEVNKDKQFLSMLNNVMDSHGDIMFAIEKEDILYANKKFYDFFKIPNLKDFHKKYVSVQNLIIKSNLSKVYIDKPIKTSEFIDYLYSLKEEQRTITLRDNDKGIDKIFLIKISFITEGYTLFNLVDITKTVITHNLLEEKAHIDALTKIYNRHKFNEVAHSLESVSRNYSLCILDIDKFKNVNDTYGHDVGDLVLLELAQLIKENIRSTDIFARWGGEEFILLFPETDYQTALNLADNLRKKVESHSVEDIPKITISMGVSHSNRGKRISDLRQKADKALYFAKEHGRNRVIGDKEI